MKTRICSLGILLLLLASCSGTGSAEKSPSKCLENAYSFYLQEDYPAMVAMYVANDNKMLSEKEADNLMSMLPYLAKEEKGKGGLRSIELTNEFISDSGKEAKVDFKKVYGNGDTEMCTQSLAKINGKWYLHVWNN